VEVGWIYFSGGAVFDVEGDGAIGAAPEVGYGVAPEVRRYSRRRGSSAAIAGSQGAPIGWRVQ
jgi:hypothetical protein